MKKYKFIGTEEEAEEYPRIIPEVGKIYSDEDKDGYNFEMLTRMKWFSEEWEEVFDEETTDNKADETTTRKFRFIGTEKEADDYWAIKPEIGKVYSGNDVIGSTSTTVQGWFDEKYTRHEWEEVVEIQSASGGLLGGLNYLQGDKGTFTFDLVFGDDTTISFVNKEQVSKDPTNPSHYKQGEIECIDAIKSAISDKVGVEAAYSANIIKYVWRYKGKNGIEDLKKAKVYLEKLIEEVEGG
jgi:hypothetical protein